MRIRFLSNANFHSTMICSPKNWMNWDMQPAGCVICRERIIFIYLLGHRKTEFFSPKKYKYVLLLSDLHFWVHTAVDCGNTPGRACSDQAISCRGEDCFFIFIEGLQWRILAWVLQLVSKKQQQEDQEHTLVRCESSKSLQIRTTVM